MRFVTLLSLSLSLLFAQGTTSRVVGTVQDPTGSAVAGAKVRLINESTGLTFETQTAEAGNYQFESVQIGLYTLEVESAGFKKEGIGGDRRHSPSYTYLFPGQEQPIDFKTTYAGNRHVKESGGDPHPTRKGPPPVGSVLRSRMKRNTIGHADDLVEIA